MKTAETSRQLQLSLLKIAKLKEQKNTLDGELAARNADLDRNSIERAELDRQLSLAKSNAQSLQEQISVVVNQKSEEVAQSSTLQAKVNELGA